VDYEALLKAHQEFVRKEERWLYYDVYLRRRNAAAWMRSGDVPPDEVVLLFWFVRSWDQNFQGDLRRFCRIYQEVFTSLELLRNESLLTIDLNGDVKRTMAGIFNRVAGCSRRGRFESTDASKILHVLIPELFVMWDDRIREELVEEEKDGRSYAYRFLPMMQEEARRCVDSYIRKHGGTDQSATRRLSGMAKEHSLTEARKYSLTSVSSYALAKLVDEYNYVECGSGPFRVETE
jgi:hypothetical protein